MTVESSGTMGTEIHDNTGTDEHPHDLGTTYDATPKPKKLARIRSFNFQLAIKPGISPQSLAMQAFSCPV